MKTEGLVEILLNRVARRLRERIGQIALISQVDQPFEILCTSLLFVARQGLADETIEFRFGDRAGSQLKLLFIALLRQIEFEVFFGINSAANRLPDVVPKEQKKNKSNPSSE